MMNLNQVAVWMDHATAHLIEYPVNQVESQVIISRFTHQEKEDTLSRGERKMHNTERHEELGYYKAIGEAIRKYDSVLLFGPTEAKSELYNVLKANHNFSGVRFTLEDTDKMTPNQERVFVQEYFSKGIEK